MRDPTLVQVWTFELDTDEFQSIHTAARRIPLPDTSNGRLVEDSGWIVPPDNVIIFARERAQQRVDRRRDVVVFVGRNFDIPDSKVGASIRYLDDRDEVHLGPKQKRNGQKKNEVWLEKGLKSGSEGPRTFQFYRPGRSR